MTKYVMFDLDTVGDLMVSPARFALLPITDNVRAQVHSMVDAVNTMEEKFKNPTITVEFEDLTWHNFLPHIAPAWFNTTVEKVQKQGAIAVDIPDWAFSDDVKGAAGFVPFICVPTEDEFSSDDIEEVEEYPDYGIEGIRVSRSNVKAIGFIGSMSTEDVESPDIGLAYFTNLLEEN